MIVRFPYIAAVGAKLVHHTPQIVVLEHRPVLRPLVQIIGLAGAPNPAETVIFGPLRDPVAIQSPIGLDDCTTQPVVILDRLGAVVGLRMHEIDGIGRAAGCRITPAVTRPLVQHTALLNLRPGIDPALQTVVGEVDTDPIGIHLQNRFPCQGIDDLLLLVAKGVGGLDLQQPLLQQALVFDPCLRLRSIHLVAALAVGASRLSGTGPDFGSGATLVVFVFLPDVEGLVVRFDDLLLQHPRLAVVFECRYPERAFSMVTAMLRFCPHKAPQQPAAKVVLVPVLRDGFHERAVESAGARDHDARVAEIVQLTILRHLRLDQAAILDLVFAGRCPGSEDLVVPALDPLPGAMRAFREGHRGVLDGGPLGHGDLESVVSEEPEAFPDGLAMPGAAFTHLADHGKFLVIARLGLHAGLRVVFHDLLEAERDTPLLIQPTAVVGIDHLVHVGIVRALAAVGGGDAPHAQADRRGMPDRVSGPLLVSVDVGTRKRQIMNPCRDSQPVSDLDEPIQRLGYFERVSGVAIAQGVIFPGIRILDHELVEPVPVDVHLPVRGRIVLRLDVACGPVPGSAHARTIRTAQHDVVVVPDTPKYRAASLDEEHIGPAVGIDVHDDVTTLQNQVVVFSLPVEFLDESLTIEGISGIDQDVIVVIGPVLLVEQIGQAITVGVQDPVLVLVTHLMPAHAPAHFLEMGVTVRAQPSKQHPIFGMPLPPIDEIRQAVTVDVDRIMAFVQSVIVARLAQKPGPVVPIAGARCRVTESTTENGVVFPAAPEYQIAAPVGVDVHDPVAVAPFSGAPVTHHHVSGGTTLSLADEHVITVRAGLVVDQVHAAVTVDVADPVLRVVTHIGDAPRPQDLV